MLINSPFNYTGNKFNLLNQLLPVFPNAKCFIDVFSGGGSVYANVLHKYDKVIVNDIISELIFIHKQLLKDDDIILKTKTLCVDKDDQDGYNELRRLFNKERKPEQLWALMLCCTNNMLRFNKKFEFNQTFGRRTWNKKTDEKVKVFTEHIRKYKDKLLYISKSFCDIKIVKDCFYYLDPPYSNTQAGYNSYWNLDDDKKLITFCHTIDKKGSKFVLSGTENHNGKNSIIIDVLKENYNFDYLNYNYDKVSRREKSSTQEIIIKNF